MRNIPTTIDMIADICDFCAKQNIAITVFCTKATGNIALMNKLRGGRVPTIMTAKKVYDFIEAYEVLDDIGS